MYQEKMSVGKKLTWLAVAAMNVALLVGHSAASEPKKTGTARAFCDVLPNFTILTPTLRPKQTLKMRLRLLNQSHSTADFSYYADFFQHITIYDSRRQKVFFRFDSPFMESAIRSVQLQSAKEFTTTIALDLQRFYDLSPGKYYLTISYDLRLISNAELVRKYAKRYHSRDFVLWDTRDYPFSIVD
jgi:hypothetical protein